MIFWQVLRSKETFDFFRSDQDSVYKFWWSVEQTTLFYVEWVNSLCCWQFYLQFISCQFFNVCILTSQIQSRTYRLLLRTNRNNSRSSILVCMCRSSSFVFSLRLTFDLKSLASVLVQFQQFMKMLTQFWLVALLLLKYTFNVVKHRYIAHDIKNLQNIHQDEKRCNESANKKDRKRRWWATSVSRDSLTTYTCVQKKSRQRLLFEWLCSRHIRDAWSHLDVW